MQQTAEHVSPLASDRITVDEIVNRQRNGETFTFVDVRGAQAWDSSDKKITGAIRIPLDKAEEHFGKLSKGQTIITYCT